MWLKPGHNRKPNKKIKTSSRNWYFWSHDFVKVRSSDINWDSNWINAPFVFYLSKYLHCMTRKKFKLLILLALLVSAGNWQPVIYHETFSLKLNGQIEMVKQTSKSHRQSSGDFEIMKWPNILVGFAVQFQKNPVLFVNIFGFVFVFPAICLEFHMRCILFVSHENCKGWCQVWNCHNCEK